jgi:hypothetical protein
MTLELDSSEEVDTVYALLGLLGQEKHMMEGKHSWMEPNYRKSVIEVKNNILENE